MQYVSNYKLYLIQNNLKLFKKLLYFISCFFNTTSPIKRLKIILVKQTKQNEVIDSTFVN